MPTRLISSLALLPLCSQITAHEAQPPIIEEIVVYGRAEPLLDQIHSASEGLVGGDDLRIAPLLRVGELAEVVPGMVATQHSGSGKANQYFLRGFNLDHGTDFSASLDGVPLNLRTHGHGQGYLDLNFMIPEMIAAARYRKGPYAVESGDFSSAGSVEFTTLDRLDNTLLELTGGEHGYARGLVAGTTTTVAGDLTAALDIARYDGPWQRDENTRQNKALLSLLTRIGEVPVRLALQAYDSRWDATDQIPERAVNSGLLSRFGNLDADLGGQTQRYALNATFDFRTWQLTAYAIDSHLDLYSNFTYFLDDPENGDEFAQQDSRRVFGVSATGDYDLTLASAPVVARWGIDIRHDDINTLGLDRTQSRNTVSTLRDDAVEESSLGSYAELEWQLGETLLLQTGVRLDHYRWDVDSLQSANSGTGNDTQVSPKLSLRYRAAERIALFANYGRGMHSNDVRGSTIQVDPLTGDPADTTPALVASDGAELGVRYEIDDRFNVSLVGFWLQLDSELVFVGDAGGTEANSGSRRVGVELTAFHQWTEWLALHGSYTLTNARYRDAPSDEDHIPGAIESTISLGLDGAWRNGVTASLRLRHLGQSPLIEDNSARASTSTLVNAGVAWRTGRLEYRLDAFNLFDSGDYDISYFYASRLPGEPAEGVEDIHFHPLEPRSLRAAVKLYL